ncbi:OmpA family protein [Rhodobacteraceae bacterium NNCM2]|nr:OmpA family protein [Coraliihabitans acroporae]
MRKTLITAIAFASLATTALANPCGFKQAGTIVIKGYPVGATAVPEAQKARLAQFAETAKHRYQICVFAQVDKQGSEEANRKVAQERANAVKAFLEAHGVAADTMKVAKQDDAFTFFGLLPEDQSADRRVVVTHD